MTNTAEDNQLEPADRNKPVFLLLLDGWGVAGKSEANAISLAKMPSVLKLIKEYPAAVLKAVSGSVNERYVALGSGVHALNEDELISRDLSALVATAGLRQLKIFDSERMAALTHFFNGWREDKIEGEDWISVSAADEEQSLNIFLFLERFIKESIKAVKSEQYDFIAAACPALEIIASTGDLLGAVSLLEKLDKQIKRLATEILNRGGILVIASAHGNAERMKSMTTDLTDKDITDNPIPLIIIGEEFKGKTIGFQDAPEGDLSLLEPAGNLTDLHALLLELMKISAPKGRGHSLKIVV